MMRTPERPLDPPERPIFTVDYTIEVFAEGPYESAAEVETWLRTQMGKQGTITRLEDEETVRFRIEDFMEEVEGEEHAADLIEDLVCGGPHSLVRDGLEITGPEVDEPDWDAIAKDRRIEEDWA